MLRKRSEEDPFHLLGEIPEQTPLAKQTPKFMLCILHHLLITGDQNHKHEGHEGGEIYVVTRNISDCREVGKHQ